MPETYCDDYHRELIAQGDAQVVATAGRGRHEADDDETGTPTTKVVTAPPASTPVISTSEGVETK